MLLQTLLQRLASYSHHFAHIWVLSAGWNSGIGIWGQRLSTFIILMDSARLSSERMYPFILSLVIYESASVLISSPVHYSKTFWCSPILIHLVWLLCESSLVSFNVFVNYFDFSFILADQSTWLCWILLIYRHSLCINEMSLLSVIYVPNSSLLCHLSLFMVPPPNRIFLFSCNHICQFYSFTACEVWVIMHWVCPYA